MNCPGPKVKRPEGEGWLTTGRAATWLGVSEKWVQKMVISGRLKPTRIGKYNWFRAEEIEAIMRNPDRLRAQANHAERIAGRQVVEQEEMGADWIDSREARGRLGICAMALLGWIEGN